MPVKVAKFGGTSLADATQFRKVYGIMQADPQRRYIVPSAPGKRDKQDRKITDLLYLCHEQARQQMPIDSTFALIAERYTTIVRDLGLSLDLKPHLAQIAREIATQASTGQSADYAASRGEYLNGLIMAAYLNWPMIDAAQVIFFNARGQLDAARTQQVLSQRLANTPQAVIPGFYGCSHEGNIKTFSRGGSDITGAIVARGAGAAVYENWTDVSGLLMADPRIVDNPRHIDIVTYRELRELAYMGASVLHDEAIFPVREAGIPVNIRNTNDPTHPGTRIVQDAGLQRNPGSITGIAGRKDFTSIDVEKAMMNQEVGFARKLLSALENNSISFEHLPSSIDTMSVIIEDRQLTGRLEKIVEDIQTACQPDSVSVDPDLALVATVGRGMASTPGMASRIFAALAAANINIRMIDQGSSEMNIIVGINTADFETAIRAIYQAFVK